MDTKIQVIKTKRPKIKLIPEKVAYCCECSPTMVRMILKGGRNNETDLGARIEVAAMLIEEKENLLLDEVKRVVTF